MTPRSPTTYSGRAVRFRSNGTPVEWTVTGHGSDYLDAMVFFERIDVFTGSGREVSRP